MLARLTSKNQLTLPKTVISAFPDVQCFDVRKENRQIVLTPVRFTGADAVRTRLAEMGLSEKDITDAVAWERRSLSTRQGVSWRAGEPGNRVEPL